MQQNPILQPFFEKYLGFLKMDILKMSKIENSTYFWNKVFLHFVTEKLLCNIFIINALHLIASLDHAKNVS